MSSQASLAQRVHARMAHMGELYVAARHATVSSPTSAGSSTSGWVSQPEHSDQTVYHATGRRWDEWVPAIDAGPGRDATHTEIAAWLVDHAQVDAWWAQGVTVGYERITGKRLPGQMPDGTFTVSRSRTLDLSATTLRDLLEDDGSRASVVPHVTTTAVSRPGVKSPRFSVVDRDDHTVLGVIQFAFDAAGSKTRLTVTHSQLPNSPAAQAWKELWSSWLDAMEHGSASVK